MAAIAAFYYPKGSSRHKKAGRVFTIAMLIMLISGGIAGALMGSVENVFLAALVSYTVFTAWLTVRHRQPVIVILEYLALAYIIIFRELVWWTNCSISNLFSLKQFEIIGLPLKQ